MDPVTLVALCQLSLGAPQRAASCPGWHRDIVLVSSNVMDRWQPLIAESSRRFGIPETWIRDVMRAESGGETMRNDRPITSRAGAMGLMQVMPETYAAMRRRLGLGPDPYDPHDNILAGAAYLGDMYGRYGYPGLFAAYNAGPQRFESYLRHGTSLPTETLDYLGQIGSGALKTVLAMQPPAASGGTRVAVSEGPKSPEFASGRALFFVIGQSSTRAEMTPKNIDLFMPLLSSHP